MSDVHRKDEIQGDIVHEYDGIEEADNRLPNWWLATFYGAILFGVVYWFYYHELQVEPTTSEAYAATAAQGNTADPASEPELLALVGDPDAIAAGRETFATTCAACHGDRAQGVIGPNLTDDHWLHGGEPLSIYTAVRDGITAERARIEGSAGMPGWGGQLGEDRVRAAIAFVLSIRDTNVEGGRPAEGEVYAPADDEGEEGEEHDEEADDGDADDEPEGDDGDADDAQDAIEEEAEGEGAPEAQEEEGEASPEE